MSIDTLIQNTTKYLSRLASYIEKDVRRRGLDENEDRVLLYMQCMEPVQNAHNRLCSTVRELSNIEPDPPVVVKRVGLDMMETVIQKYVDDKDVKVSIMRRSLDKLSIEFHYIGTDPYYYSLDKLRMLDMNELIGGRIKYYKPSEHSDKIATLKVKMSEYPFYKWMSDQVSMYLEEVYPGEKLEIVYE